MSGSARTRRKSGLRLREQLRSDARPWRAPGGAVRRRPRAPARTRRARCRRRTCHRDPVRLADGQVSRRVQRGRSCDCTASYQSSTMPWTLNVMVSSRTVSDCADHERLRRGGHRRGGVGGGIGAQWDCEGGDEQRRPRLLGTPAAPSCSRRLAASGGGGGAALGRPRSAVRAGSWAKRTSGTCRRRGRGDR